MGNKKIVPIKDKFNKTFQKTKQEVKISGKRLGVILIIFIVVLSGLMLRIGYIQFIQGSKLKEEAYAQSTSDSIISAKRGTIYDCNKKALAISADVDTISVNPSLIIAKVNGKKDDDATKDLKEKMANKMAEIFSLNYDDVYVLS